MSKPAERPPILHLGGQNTRCCGGLLLLDCGGVYKCPCGRNQDARAAEIIEGMRRLGAFDEPRKEGQR